MWIYALIAIAGALALSRPAGATLPAASAAGPPVRPGTAKTRPGGRPGGTARVYAAAPAPGKWWRVKKSAIKPVMVEPTKTSPFIKGVRITRKDQSLAWRAYVQNKSTSKFAGLNPLIGRWSKVKALVGLKSDISQGIQQGMAQNWAGLAESSAAAIEKGIEGIKDGNQAAGMLVAHMLYPLLENIVRAPENAHLWNPNAPNGNGLILEDGASVFIPRPAVNIPKNQAKG